MKILLVTQNEPFYLAKNLDWLLSKLSHERIDVVGCVCANPSVFGKKISFFDKIIQTYKVFGFRFFAYYTFRYLYSKCFYESVSDVLKKWSVPLIDLSNSINHPESLKCIASYQPELIVSILGNEIFKKPFIDLAKEGVINLHTALLPKYRGLMPTFWVLKNKEKYTGVSVFYVDEGIDSGDIILQEKVEILENESQKSLIARTKAIGMSLIVEAIVRIQEGTVVRQSNPDEQMTYYTFPTKKDV